MRFLYYFLLIGLLSTACRNTDMTMAEAVIPVNLEKEVPVSFNDLFSKLELIPLETTKQSVMGYPISKLLVKEGNLYLSTPKEQTIWVFDRHGKFLRKISHEGNGPYEYVSMSDFNFNPFTNDLEILCPFGYICVYDSLGENFKKRISLNQEKIRSVHFFTHLAPEKYLFFSNSAEGNKMFWYDAGNSRFYAEDYNLPTFLFFNTPYHHSSSPFYSRDTVQNFVQAYNGEVYTVDTSGKLHRKYAFDFGEYNFDISHLEEADVEYYVRYSRSIGSRYANSFIAYGENDRYYMARFKFRNQLKHLLYDKKEKQAQCFGELKEGGYAFPVFMDNEALYMFADAGEIGRAVSPTLLSEEYNRILDTMTIDDNPIIIKYTFKPPIGH